MLTTNFSRRASIQRLMNTGREGCVQEQDCLQCRFQLRCFSSMIAWMSSGDGPLGPGLPFLPDEYSSRYLRFISRSWNFNSVDGRIITAARWIRRGSRNSDQKPNRNRSSAERLGARRRERLMTRSCCFMSRLLATTVLAPPGPRSLAIVVNRCARSTSRSFVGEPGRGGCFQEQVCPSCRFQLIISNSPRSALTVGPCLLCFLIARASKKHVPSMIWRFVSMQCLSPKPLQGGVRLTGQRIKP
jgi:hypothetical protein